MVRVCGEIVLLGVSASLSGCSKPVSALPESTAMVETSAAETVMESIVETAPEETTEAVTEPETLWQVVGAEDETRTSTNTMYLYAEPDDKSDVICEVPGGEEVIFKGEVVTSEGDSSPFICVEYDGKAGYTFWEIFAEPIVAESTEATTEVEESTEEAGTGVEAGGMEIQEASGTKYATEQVNVRQEPSKDSEKIGSLSWSDSVEVTGITSDGKWYRINLDGQEGFASASYLSDTKPEKQVVSQPDNGGNGGGEAQPDNGSSGEEARPDNGANGDEEVQAGEYIPGLGVAQDDGLPDGMSVDEFWESLDYEAPDGWDDIVWE